MAYNTYNLKESANRPERFVAGHRMCAGCGGSVAVRAVLRALRPEDRAVINVATSCLEVSSCTYPYTSWNDSFLHTAFENAAAATSGVEAAYTAMKKKGKLRENYKFITFGGDGGTYDIGFQSLSGAMERGTDMVYVCYDNEAYMNTGIQRSSSTPIFADTTTSAIGSKSDGKIQFKKDLTKIMAAHHIPYVAQTTFVGNFRDIHQKSETAIYTEGPAFLNVLAPCPRGWRYAEPELMDICKAAVDSCVWPLFEVIDGEWVLNYEPKKKLPVREYLAMQGRFRHLFDAKNAELIERIQDNIDRRWEELKGLCNIA
ncbi:MAG: pyruvate ferredoxin oxidoreductase [Clostridiales Family XIII bacterium]|jgi:pyruvate ferredoxin oxidoreductase beta subunit|nr:pyruvate ferredoxin oxidoreductase [Clostridiales Family XIII bacterium]